MGEKWTPGPWFVRDFRATKMRELGWAGPGIDRIVITNKTGPELIESAGDNSVIARIQFDNRPEELGETSIADARLIAAAPAMAEALASIADESVFNQQRFAEDTDTDYFLRCFKAVKDRARAALALARGER